MCYKTKSDWVISKLLLKLSAYYRQEHKCTHKLQFVTKRPAWCNMYSMLHPGGVGQTPFSKLGCVPQIFMVKSQRCQISRQKIWFLGPPKFGVLLVQMLVHFTCTNCVSPSFSIFCCPLKSSLVTFVSHFLTLVSNVPCPSLGHFNCYCISFQNYKIVRNDAQKMFQYWEGKKCHAVHQFQSCLQSHRGNVRDIGLAVPETEHFCTTPTHVPCMSRWIHSASLTCCNSH